MRANLFLLLNAVVVIYLVLRIIFNRRAGPTSLKFDDSKKKYPMTDADQAAFEATGSPSDFRGYEKTGERSLNCWFQFNGHTWDAFEVLGVPAGSSREACERAMIDLRRRQDPTTSDDFLDAAWAALEDRFKAGSA